MIDAAVWINHAQARKAGTQYARKEIQNAARGLRDSFARTIVRLCATTNTTIRAISETVIYFMAAERAGHLERRRTYRGRAPRIFAVRFPEIQSGCASGRFWP